MVETKKKAGQPPLWEHGTPVTPLVLRLPTYLTNEILEEAKKRDINKSVLMAEVWKEWHNVKIGLHIL